MNKRVFVTYLMFAFLLAWPIYGVIFIQGGLSSPLFSVLTSISMWAPALAVYITKKLNGGLRILEPSMKPNLKNNIRWYIIAFITPIIYGIIGAILYFIIFPNQFDSGMPGIKDLGIIKILIMVIAMPLFTTILTLGEEIGWRGFLFPEVRKRTTEVKANIICGIIWGLWHAPVIAMGYNFGVGYLWFPWLGILGMCVFCISLGTLLSYITSKSGSIWPAALAHGTNNALSTLPLIIFYRKEIPHSSFAVSVISIIPILILAIALIVYLIRHKD